jgi:hypothetical protein
VPVEQLREGGLVLTRSGLAKPIVWIGRRRVACARHKAPHNVLPVRIRAGAFAIDVPRRDLLLSPDHAVFADGVLIPVKHLINGITVRQECVATAEYFHVELAAHDILLAEGLAVESYLDSGNRAEFANRPCHVVLLHPGLASAGCQTRCAPLCLSGPPLVAVKQMLLSRLEQGDYATTIAPDLHLVADARKIHPVIARGNLYRFMLPDRVDRVRIVSRSGAPAEIAAESEDGRRLGVAIQTIVMDGRLVALDDKALAEGFYDIEHHGAVSWRWTNGSAALVIAPVRSRSASPRMLELLVRATMRSWLAPQFDAVRAA